MKNIRTIYLLLVSTILCGLTSGLAAKETKKTDIKVSKFRFQDYSQSPQTQSKTRLSLSLDGQNLGGGVFHWNKWEKESRLLFRVNYLDVWSSSYSSRPALLERGYELFTKVNINEVPRDYNTKGAKIFLRYDGDVIEVGRYDSLVNVPYLLERTQIFDHPTICEGPYESVCSLELVFDASDGNRPSTTVRLRLKGDLNETVEMKTFPNSNTYNKYFIDEVENN